jgi:hypothetical protein
MKTYTIQIEDEEEKALLTDMISVQDWIENAIHNKSRQCIDKVVEDYSNKQPQKTSELDKFKIVRDAKVTTAAEKQIEILSQH